MAKKKQPALYVVTQRYQWLTYVEDGHEDDPIQAEVLVRRNLTEGEFHDLRRIDPLPEGLTGSALQDAIDAQNLAVADAIAPFIRDWNMGYVDDDGNVAKAEPPEERDGAHVLRFLPPRIVGQIRWDLLNRSTGLVKAKSSTPLGSTDISSGDVPSIPSGTEEA